MQQNFARLLPWLAVALVAFLLFSMMEQAQQGVGPQAVSYSNFLDRVQAGEVQSVTIEGQDIRGTFASGQQFSTYKPEGADVITPLEESGVRIDAVPVDDGDSIWWRIFLSWVPFLLLIGVLIYFYRRARGGSGGAMSFGKSQAKLLNEDSRKAKFADVAGVEEAKQELQEVVDFLKHPEKFRRLGGHVPKGALLVGPPGTGKTLLARAIAGEAGVPFFTVSGSAFIEMFVGVGASRVRDMFAQAKKNAPCVVFIDELDALGRKRGAGLGGGNDEREQTLNQLLVEMDGFETSEGIIIIAATNRPDVLDPALTRPGRFDRQITVPNPDVGGRESILKVHMAKIPAAPDVDPKVIARGTPGFSGADLENLVNEAALMAARTNKRVVTMRDFEMAKDKIIMGAERRSMVMTEEEKAITAYHEAGHALIAIYEPHNDPLHKVSIIPRGRALGVTVSLPTKDRYGWGRQELMAQLVMLYGGRVAEELIYGKEEVGTGAGDDIRRATEIAQRMVTEWGMSERLGPLNYAGNPQEVFLGDQLTRESNVSEYTARLIDEEVSQIINEAESKCRRILTEHIEELHRLAQALLKYETLTAEEVNRVLKDEEPRPGDPLSDEESADRRPKRASVPNAGKPKGPGTGPEPAPQPG